MKKMRKKWVLMLIVLLLCNTPVNASADIRAGTGNIYAATMTEIRVRENYPIAGVSIALADAYDEGVKEGERLIKEQKRKEKIRKAKLKAKRQKEKEEAAAALAYAKAHPHYEIYVDGQWYHMNTEWQDYMKDLCDEQGLSEKDFQELLVQLFVESRYTPNLISPTDDWGIAQINSCNHDRLRRELGVSDFLDPYQGIKCNVYMMAGYLKQYTDSQAFSKYNTGRPYDSTTYSRKILGIYNNGQGVRVMEE